MTYRPASGTIVRTDSTKSSVCASGLMFCATNSTGTNASNQSRGLCRISLSNGLWAPQRFPTRSMAPACSELMIAIRDIGSAGGAIEKSISASRSEASKLSIEAIFFDPGQGPARRGRKGGAQAPLQALSRRGSDLAQVVYAALTRPQPAKLHKIIK